MNCYGRKNHGLWGDCPTKSTAQVLASGRFLPDGRFYLLADCALVLGFCKACYGHGRTTEGAIDSSGVA